MSGCVFFRHKQAKVHLSTASFGSISSATCLENNFRLISRLQIKALFACSPIVSGVSPIANDEQTRCYVKEQRKQQLEDLKRCMKVVSKEPCASSSPEEFTMLYLIERNRLIVSKREEHTDLCAIANAILKLFAADDEVYWLFSSFAAMWEEQIEATDLVSGS